MRNNAADFLPVKIQNVIKGIYYTNRKSMKLHWTLTAKIITGLNTAWQSDQKSLLDQLRK